MTGLFLKHMERSSVTWTISQIRRPEWSDRFRWISPHRVGKLKSSMITPRSSGETGQCVEILCNCSRRFPGFESDSRCTLTINSVLFSECIFTRWSRSCCMIVYVSKASSCRSVFRMSIVESPVVWSLVNAPSIWNWVSLTRGFEMDGDDWRSSRLTQTGRDRW